MTDQIREQLSALLDGELPKDEMGLLVRRLEKDEALRLAFGSYALIGETLRAPGGRVASPSFAARVSAAIDATADAASSAGIVAPAVAAARSREPVAAPADAPGSSGAGSAALRTRLWQRPMVRTALAASAAVVAVLIFRPETPQVAGNDSAPTGVFATTASPTPAQSQRLASYMVAHSQYSTPMVRRNVLSGLLAADSGITRVSYEMGEAP